MQSSLFGLTDAPQDPRIKPGRLAHVHWHVTHRVYSVKYSGQPVFEVPAVHMRNCRFHVDARLRAKFEAKPTRRTVHALIVGEIVAFNDAVIDGEHVSCNPFRYHCFARPTDNVKALTADEIALHKEGWIEARGLTVDLQTDALWIRT